jgi:hypothetical protein
MIARPKRRRRWPADFDPTLAIAPCLAAMNNASAFQSDQPSARVQHAISRSHWESKERSSLHPAAITPLIRRSNGSGICLAIYLLQLQRGDVMERPQP